MTAVDQPLMADVAARAGVSTMTVSRVLNGYPGVRPETRAKVESVVAELGYRANAAARTLAGGRSRILGVVGVDMANVGPSHTLFGIEAAARTRDHVLSFATLRHVDEQEMRESLAHLNDAHVDGAIVIAPSQDVVDALPASGVAVPLVIISGADLPGRSSAAVDQHAGARLATQHLLSLGHSTVHHVRGPKGWVDADAREAGWRAELRAHGIKAPRPYVGDWSPKSGYDIGEKLAADPDVQAIFVANDQMALGLLLAFAVADRSAPHDFHVVGFDDIPEAAYFTPPLTTVRQDFDRLGREAVDLLLRMIDGDLSEQHVAVQPELIVRHSTVRANRPDKVRAR
jgi:DNA-binding LacI/PurR family transcriptional regulator